MDSHQVLGSSPGDVGRALGRDRRLAPGTMVSHFEVVRLIGEGGMGEVYLARDLRLGRKVAVKLIRLSALDSRDARDRFLREARITARFNHPNIVTVYEVGRQGDDFYLALEYLEGVNLRQRMREGRISISESQRVILSVALALREAHAAGLVHKDIKPENVFLCRNGTIKLLDFGVAQQRDTPAERITKEGGRGKFLVRGTAGYLSPEQWRAGRASPATDVWALGVMFYELIVGERPFRAKDSREMSHLVRHAPLAFPELVPGLQKNVQQLIESCLAKEPENRPTADEVVQVLTRIVHGTTVRDLQEGQSPFPGLEAFDESMAHFFFGREREIAAFVERLRSTPVLAVVGPSGAGKSSFVRAGVAARLLEQGNWAVLQVRPGPHPFEALAARIAKMSVSTTMRRVLVPSDSVENVSSRDGTHRSVSEVAVRESDSTDHEDFEKTVPLLPRDTGFEDMAQDRSTEHEDLALLGDPGGLAQALRDNPRFLSLVLYRLSVLSGMRILLVVDQMEEVYTLGADLVLRDRFVAAVCQAADDPSDMVRVTFTLRDDFLGKIASTPEAREALGHVMVLRAPDQDALRDILLRPLDAVGYRFDDDRLVDEMVRQVSAEAASLPLLQFTAKMLWDRRDRKRRLLLRSAYAEIGGVEGALAVHSDAVIDKMPARDVDVARRMLLRLVTPEGARRAVQRDLLVDGLGAGAGAVLDRLLESRLLSVRAGDEGHGDDGLVELVHESLIGRWRRLARWLGESRDDRTLLDDFSKEAELWHRRGRQVRDLLTGPELIGARRVLDDRDVRVPELVEEYLSASLREDARRRRLRRWRRIGLSIVLLAVAFVATAVAWILSKKEQEALHGRREALRQREIAEKRRIEALVERAEAQREGARAAFVQGAWLDARAKLRSSLETQDSAVGRALWRNLSGIPEVWEKDFGAYLYQVAFSPDAKTLAVPSQDRSIYILDRDTLAVHFLRGHGDQVVGVSFSDDGCRLVSVEWNGRVWVWDLRRDAPLFRWKPKKGKRWMSLSLSGKRLWLSDPGGKLVILRWSAKKVSASGSFCPKGSKAKVTILPRQRGAVVMCETGRTVFVDANLKVVEVLHAPKGFVVLTYLPGKKEFLATKDGVLAVLDGKLRHPRILGTGKIQSMGLTLVSDGTVAVFTRPGLRQVRVWDLDADKLVMDLNVKMPVFAMSLSRDGRWLAATTWDKKAHLWDLHMRARKRVVRGHLAQAYGISFNKDGRIFATAGMGGRIVLWDAASGGQLRVIPCKNSSVGVTFSPDGKLIGAGCGRSAVHFWDWRTGVLVRTLYHSGGAGQDLRFSPDGRTLAMGTKSGRVVVWNWPSGRLVAMDKIAPWKLFVTRFSPDSRLLAISSYGTKIFLWDVQKRRFLRPLAVPMQGIYGLAFSRDGKTLYSAGSDGNLRAWNLKSHRAKILYHHPTRIYTLDVDRRSGLLGIPSADKTAFVLDPATGRRRVVFEGHRDEVNIFKFSRDGRMAVTTSDDGTVRVWNTKTGAPLWYTVALLSKPAALLTNRGWSSLDDRPLDDSFLRSQWKAQLDQDGRIVSQSRDGSVICFGTKSGGLYAWEGSRRLFERRVVSLERLMAFPGGCLALERKGSTMIASLTDRSGKVSVLAESASAVTWSAGRAMVVVPGELLFFDEAGRRTGRRTVPIGTSAAALVGDWIVVGNRDGNIQLLSPEGGKEPNFSFKNVPASSVLQLTAGPMDTVIAGFANGLVGIWSLRNGTRIDWLKLHGPVLFLNWRGKKLDLATALGDHATVDLSVFEMSYCELMRKIWQAIPVTWKDGLPRKMEPPKGHMCRSTGHEGS